MTESLDNETISTAHQILSELLEQMSIKAQIDIQEQVREASTDQSEEGESIPLLNINLVGDSADLATLIGRKGQTLEALQHLTKAMIAQKLQRAVNLDLDVDGYRERRIAQLRRLATRLAQSAVQTRKTVSMEPLPANERRIVHMTLADFPGVTTNSVGEGVYRRVTIVPKR